VLPYALPMSRLIPQVQRAIEQRIHQPVSIGTLRLFILPVPHLQARTITVGRGNLLDVDSITIYPSVLTLLSDTKVIREVEVRGVRARFELLGVARSLVSAEATQRTRAGADQQGGIQLIRVTLRDVTLRFPTFALSGLSADIALKDGKATEIRASQQRDHLQLTARRQNGDTWSMDILAHDWKLPVGVPVQFDRLEGNANITATGIEVRKLTGALYGGTFNGPVSLSWKSGWSLAGRLQIDGIDLEPAVALVNREAAMSGKLTAAPSFTSQSREAANLLNELQLESDFAVEHGVLQKIDLVAATKNPLDRKAGKGGKTEFDELKGHVVFEQHTYEFSDLHIASGLFRAQGEVTVNPDKTLGGVIRAELRGTAALVSIPFDLSGKIGDPSLFPTRGAMAGAVAGTMLMPGIGTAVGMKAGEWTERLLGRKKPNRRQTPAPK